MKFDFCIGNPPYQEERQGDSNTATPVYNNFMEAAYETAYKTMLITPARFLFNAGYTPKSWNEKMLSDEHFKVLKYMPNASEAFVGVDIKGGVAITYRDEQKKFGAINIFTQFKELNTICKKVASSDRFKSLADIIVSSFAYHYTSLFYDENPSLKGRSSKGHDYDLQSNAFSMFPEVFFESKKNRNEYVRILGRENQSRCWKYIKRKYVKDVVNLNGYKAFYPKATGEYYDEREPLNLT